ILGRRGTVTIIPKVKAAVFSQYCVMAKIKFLIGGAHRLIAVGGLQLVQLAQTVVVWVDGRRCRANSDIRLGRGKYCKGVGVEQQGSRCPTGSRAVAPAVERADGGNPLEVADQESC